MGVGVGRRLNLSLMTLPGYPHSLHDFNDALSPHADFDLVQVLFDVFHLEFYSLQTTLHLIRLLLYSFVFLLYDPQIGVG